MFPCTAGVFLSEGGRKPLPREVEVSLGKGGKKSSCLLLGFIKLTHSFKRQFSFSPTKTRTLQGANIVGYFATSTFKKYFHRFIFGLLFFLFNKAKPHHAILSKSFLNHRDVVEHVFSVIIEGNLC